MRPANTPGSNNKLQVVIIESNRLLRDNIVANFRKCRDVGVIAALANLEAVKLKTCGSSDIALLGANLGLMQTVKKELPSAKLVVMDLDPAQGDLLEFVRAGVSGFILKEATVNDFLQTIKSVAQGAKVLPSSLTASLFSQIAERETARTVNGSTEAMRLTRREREIIDLIADGLSNKEIAQRLSIALHTVKSHVHNVLEKLALRTRLEIASYANGRMSNGK
jgi:DNA-binding NarL/FixJ family response regulator